MGKGRQEFLLILALLVGAGLFLDLGFGSVTGKQTYIADINIDELLPTTYTTTFEAVNTYDPIIDNIEENLVILAEDPASFPILAEEEAILVALDKEIEEPFIPPTEQSSIPITKQETKPKSWIDDLLTFFFQEK
tara:strand:- start:104 stop:508 length:405 start_codon:yes stop_codon:yes gene_type:complete